MSLKLLCLVHFVLALAPIGIRFVPPHINALPLIWALTSINLSQLMLLSIYVAMFSGNARRRLLGASVCVIYIGFCQTIAEYAVPGLSIASFGSSYLRYVGMDVCILVILILPLTLARKAFGSIRRMPVIPPATADSRLQFSLFSILLLLSLSSLAMGLVKLSRATGETDPAGTMVLQVALFAVVFGTNIVATVWSTLGVGSVCKKLAAVVAVSVILGLSLGVSARHDTFGWWILASSTLTTLIPTAIMAATLLSLRPLGFRLTRVAAETSPTGLREEASSDNSHEAAY